MDGEFVKGLVKALLEKHFGPPKSSLNVGETDAAGNRLYFYTLPAGKEKEISALRALLGMRDTVDGLDRLPELRQTIPEKNEALDELPQCVCFREEEGSWTARFHVINGVVYHRTFGNQVAATLQTDGFPSVTLSDSADDFYGFWKKLRRKKRAPYDERDGISYWMNKALRINGRFRGFAVDFFEAVGKREKCGILLDAARAIGACGCFLPPVSYRQLLEFHNGKELIRSLPNAAAELPVNFNKTNLNVGYVMAMLAPAIEERDRKLLIKLDEAAVSDAVSLKLLYDGFSAEEFVRCRYRSRFTRDGFDEYEIRTYVDDYLTMCRDAGEKLRLGLDMDALVRAHDALNERLIQEAYREKNKGEFAYPLVSVPSKFDALDQAIRETGSTEFERIRTTERLFQEGAKQHNCVFSRREKVRWDKASIYHWSHGGASYTIQFCMDRKKNYAVEEVRARFNKTITDAHLKDLRAILAGVCTVDDVLAEPLFPQEPPPAAGPRRRLQAAFDWDPEEELPF